MGPVDLALARRGPSAARGRAGRRARDDRRRARVERERQLERRERRAPSAGSSRRGRSASAPARPASGCARPGGEQRLERARVELDVGVRGRQPGRRRARSATAFTARAEAEVALAGDQLAPRRSARGPARPSRRSEALSTTQTSARPASASARIDSRQRPSSSRVFQETTAIVTCGWRSSRHPLERRRDRLVEAPLAVGGGGREAARAQPPAQLRVAGQALDGRGERRRRRPGATRRQFSPSRRYSAEPPVPVAITGVPTAIASSGTSPNGSGHSTQKSSASAAA